MEITIMSLACTSQHCTRLVFDTLTSTCSLSLLPPCQDTSTHHTLYFNAQYQVLDSNSFTEENTQDNSAEVCAPHLVLLPNMCVCVCVCVVVIVRYPFTLLPHRCPSHCLTPVWWVPVCQSQCGLWQWCLWLQFCLLWLPLPLLLQYFIKWVC